MHFPEQWFIRPPRTTVTDDSTGNKRPGPKPNKVAVGGLLQQRFPRTEQTQIGEDRVVSEELLLLDPVITRRLGRPVSDADVAINAAGDVYRIARDPKIRRPVRGRRTEKYVALVVSTASDIKEK